MDQPRATYALLSDGSTVQIAPARPADADDIRRMHEQMSPGSSYFRFFSFSPQAPEREAQRLTRPPGPDHVALLARLGGELIGVASYELSATEGVAEIAFAVSDEMRGRGVATLLLEHLVSIARRRRLTAFAAETLPDNIAMQRVFGDAGLHVQRRFADGVVELTLPLPGSGGDQLNGYLAAVASRASRADVASLRHLLCPGSIAVIGASRQRGSVGREVLHNLVAGGFGGVVYPVNPSGATIEGLTSLPSAADLPAGTDLAVVAVPAAEVAEVAEQCGQRGVRALIVITAGFDQVSGSRLLRICRRFGMRLVGPNCFGVLNTAAGLNTTFAGHPPPAGTAGLVVQSGGMGVALLEHIGRLGIGVSSFASVGDKYDVSSNDMLTWWEQDGQTTMAIVYVESFGNPRQFGLTARRVAHRLPVLTVIGGRSAAGRQAAINQRAASAASLVSQQALFGQAGIIAAESLGDLIGTAALLSCQPHPAGRRGAIVSSAAGAGVLAADACTAAGLHVAELAEATQSRLAALLPPGATVAGPVDTTAAVTVPGYRACLEQVAADPGIDAILAIAVPTAVADLGQAILTSAQAAKPVAAALLDRPESVAVIGSGDGRIPVYADPETAACALAHAAAYAEWRGRDRGQIPDFADIEPAGARGLIADFLSRHPDGGWLPAAAASWLAESYHIPLAESHQVSDAAGAVAAAARLGGPVVLKADVAGLVRRSHAGAVKLDLHTPEEVARAYEQLAAAFGAELLQVQVQPMLTGGIELMVGVRQEPVFGPLVVIAPGGLASELLGGQVARLAPLTDVDAADLLRSAWVAPLLFGERDDPAADTARLTEVLLRVSRLADDLPEVAELDLSPVIARPDAVLAVSVRVAVAPAAPRDPFLRQLR